MNLCKAPLKCVLFILNVIFWGAGALMLYAGIVFINANYKSIGQVNAWPAVILLCSASVLILGGLIGCIGAISEKKTCLGLFLVFLASVLIVQASISGIMFAGRPSAKETFDDFLVDQFKDYGNFTMPATNGTKSDTDFNTTMFVDDSQINLECCGYNNYTDWFNPDWNYNKTTVPLSCCKPLNSTTNATCIGSVDPDDLYLIYTKGCEKPIDKIFHQVYSFLSWSALALAILIFVGSAIVIGLMCHNRNKPLGYSHLSPQYTEA